ncbi:type IV pilus assembly protein PilM [Clostridium pasteurianum]|uniref:Type IV pilus assembly protein PilM n=1 Tax=Clostridium pasteurianum BC1 TaxID=86416 RepID=R4K6M7_CLOPA|nr:type IV pilus assembly protein PilM [Clostridium pasteurianum]AGK98208.1 type IV pilus assembly protein PilM [Clostridium pasteurianum BC1]
MFSKDIMAVNIGDSIIKIIVGNKSNIKLCESIKTPAESIVNGKMVNLDVVALALRKFINKNNINVKRISFAINGQDIVIRQIETPIMKDKEIKKSVDWEMNQYLREEGSNHYIDFEKVDTVMSEDKKVYKLLVAAAPRDKVDQLVELSKTLNMKLISVDVLSNCIVRAFQNFGITSKEMESIAVIDIGYENTSIIILEKGKFFIERVVPFGLNNIVREISRKNGIDIEEAFTYIDDKYDINSLNNDDETEKRIETLFENVYSTFAKVIQFYTSNNTKKSIDEIFIIGSGCKIKGIDRFTSNYFSIKTTIADSPEIIKLNAKFSKEVDFKSFVSTFGLLLRKE